MNKRILLNILLVLSSLFVGLVACELILIATHWSPQKTTSEYLQFGYSTGIPVWDEDGLLEEARPVKVKLFQPDEKLFWRTIPDTEFTNAQGFRGKKNVSVANSHQAVRILILGDSCSFLGRTLYADVLAENLRRDYPETHFEVINASVPGYTSFQGEKFLGELLQYKPHYACIYFGWNDHWILPSGYSDRFHFDLIHSFKVVQLARILWARATDMRDYRVPLDGYRANVTAMVKQLQDKGVIPVLIAAPAGYAQRGMPGWAFNFYQEYYRMSAEEIERIPATHQAYVEVVAEVSKDFDTIYVDAPGYLRQRSPDLKPFFRNDLIHLKERGHEALADAIYAQMKTYNASKNLSWEALVRAKPTE